MTTNSEPASTSVAAAANLVHRDGAGLCRVHVFDKQDTAELLISALTGDEYAGRLIDGISQSLAYIQAGRRGKPRLCLLCPRPLKRQFSVVLVTPERDDPQHLLSAAVCPSCSRDRETLLARAVEGLKMLWPDVHPITVTHPQGGSA